MRRQGSPLQGLPSRPTQFNLFAHPADSGQTRGPEWRMLPPETRRNRPFKAAFRSLSCCVSLRR
jgi:hypothetical protein